MSDDAIYGVNPLAERIKFDRWGFIIFATVGSIAIVAAKAYAIDPTWVAFGALGLMIIYAVTIRGTLIGRLRGDQAGDNCYYLGLIYTLSSLAYAIFTFDPNDTATTIVQGFGIALTTTIGGLILRVFFNQTRVDLVDIEENARLELAEAASRLKSELAQVTVSMNDFGRQTRQSLVETQAQANELIQVVVEQGVKGIEMLTTTAGTGLEAYFTQLGVNSKKLGAATGRVVAALDGQADNIEKLNAATSAVSGHLEGIAQIASSLESVALSLEEQARTAGSVQSIIRSDMETMTGAIGAQAPLVRSIDQTLVALQNQIMVQLEALKKTPGEAINQASETLIDAANRVRVELDQLVVAHRNTLQGLNDQLAAAGRIARESTAVLEADLAKSQSAVRDFQSTLADARGTIAQQVEQPSGT